jgi:hypothetical protein
MARGSKPGERRGGRKEGAANVKTREIADKAAAEGITPLEVLLGEMRILHKQVTESRAIEGYDPQTLVMQVSELRKLADSAAPYMHPRLQSATVKVDPIEVRMVRRVIVRDK